MPTEQIEKLARIIAEGRDGDADECWPYYERIAEAVRREVLEEAGNKCFELTAPTEDVEDFYNWLTGEGA